MSMTFTTTVTPHEVRAQSTFRIGSRKCGGFRPFKRSGPNSRFVPTGDIHVSPFDSVNRNP